LIPCRTRCSTGIARSFPRGTHWRLPKSSRQYDACSCCLLYGPESQFSMEIPVVRYKPAMGASCMIYSFSSLSPPHFVLLYIISSIIIRSPVPTLTKSSRQGARQEPSFNQQTSVGFMIIFPLDKSPDKAPRSQRPTTCHCCRYRALADTNKPEAFAQILGV